MLFLLPELTYGHADMSDELRRLDDERMSRVEKKIDDIIDKLACLPCKERIEVTKSIRSDVTWLQKIIVYILTIGIPSLITLAIGWGVMSSTVNFNYTRLNNMESVLSKDVQELKIKTGIKEGIDHGRFAV